MSAATGALALFVLPMSALSERFGRRTVMTASLAVAVTVGPAGALRARRWAALVALRAVQGAALAGLPASAMAYLAEEVRPKALVTAIGLFVAGNSVGGMSGRIITGWVAQEWGWRARSARSALIAVACAVAFRLLLPGAAALHARLAAARGCWPGRSATTSPTRCCGGCTRSARCS